jgi:hypothetical protein
MSMSTNPRTGQPLTDDQRTSLFEQFLRCLDREENLIHYRLTWGLQWNIACFAALFAIEHSEIQISFKPYVQIVLVIFGISVSTLSLIAIMAAHKQTNFLFEQLNRRLWSRIMIGVRPNSSGLTEIQVFI